MSKLKLRLDELEVTSFEVIATGGHGIGTIKGREAVVTDPGTTYVYTACNDPGCDNTPATNTYCVTCDVSNCDTVCQSCPGSCGGVSCDPSYCNTQCPTCTC